MKKILFNGLSLLLVFSIVNSASAQDLKGTSTGATMTTLRLTKEIIVQKSDALAVDLRGGQLSYEIFTGSQNTNAWTSSKTLDGGVSGKGTTFVDATFDAPGTNLSDDTRLVMTGISDASADVTTDAKATKFTEIDIAEGAVQSVKIDLSSNIAGYTIEVDGRVVQSDTDGVAADTGSANPEISLDLAGATKVKVTLTEKKDSDATVVFQ